MAEFAEHRRLLVSISLARKEALLLVAKALDQMSQLSSDLEDYRNKVAVPIRDNQLLIPLEAHLEGLKTGILRLGEFRKRSAKR